tara:strand:+ start:558 stop:884 length:327 start_codon:yes stop_codon:yes gene_type:complete
MDDITLRKEVYRKITELIRDGADIYHIFSPLDLPKTVNMNGITINLSAIDIKDIHAIHAKLQNISYKPAEIEEISEMIPEYVPQHSVIEKPTYKPLRLTKLQKLILSV